MILKTLPQIGSVPQLNINLDQAGLETRPLYHVPKPAWSPFQGDLQAARGTKRLVEVWKGFRFSAPFTMKLTMSRTHSDPRPVTMPQPWCRQINSCPATTGNLPKGMIVFAGEAEDADELSKLAA